MQKPNKLPRDINARAAQIVALSTGQPLPKITDTPEAPKAASAPVREKNPAAVALGRLGGLKGGNARAKALTKKKRAEIAKLAASARWKKSEN
jgi:hypothetical protein